MNIIEVIKKNREAGTPGPWEYGGGRTVYADARKSDEKNSHGALAVIVAGEDNAWIYEHDSHRIARVPELEAIALAAAAMANAETAAEQSVRYNMLKALLSK